MPIKLPLQKNLNFPLNKDQKLISLLDSFESMESLFLFLFSPISHNLNLLIFLNETLQHRPSEINTFRQFFDQGSRPTFTLLIGFLDFVPEEIDFVTSRVRFYFFGDVVLLDVEFVQGQADFFAPD